MAEFEFVTDDQLDAIGARHAAATKGPWKVGEKYREHLVDGSPEDREVCPIVCAAPANELGYAWWKNGNAAFIANAHTDVTLLLAEVRRLRGLGAREVGVQLLADAHPDRMRAEGLAPGKVNALEREVRALRSEVARLKHRVNHTSVEDRPVCGDPACACAS